MKITPIEVSQIFYYSNGQLFWKNDAGRWGRIKSGTPCGGVRKDGYLDVRVRGVCYLVHRLIWAIHHREWPKQRIDHINGIRTDNRIENLRDVSDRVNCENKHGPQKNNSLGYLGVWRHQRKFRSAITSNGVRLYLGIFETAEEAHAAYEAVKKKVHNLG